MANQNKRGGVMPRRAIPPAEPERKHEGGGNMGAGSRAGRVSGAEKPEKRDDEGSRESGRDWD